MGINNSKIFVISGPGGAGKTTLVNRLMLRPFFKKTCLRGITATTRLARPGEKDGRDYFFFTPDRFRHLLREGFFLEHQEVIGNYYGTPKYFYTRAGKDKKNLILCIDVKGGLYLKKNFKVGKIITIFICAPTKEDLYRRLKKRTEAADIIKRRIKLAEEETRLGRCYDYMVTNGKIEETLKILEAIFLSQEYRRIS